jgi:NADH:ubiquinone oxidoreductase subunit E
MTSACKNSNELYHRLKNVIDEKKSLQNPLIEILREAQEIFGYLPVEVQRFVSEEMNIPINQIYGVVTFYNFFSMKQRGKFIINVCTGTACYVKGAPRLIQMLEEELQIKMGETTPDGLFTLSSVRCVGACSLAPVFVIGEETFGRVDNRKKLSQIIQKYKTQ